MRNTFGVSVLVLSSLLNAPPTRAAERPWIFVRSPHFSVLSNAGEKPTRKVAWEFEQVRSLVPRLWPWAHLPAVRPVQIIAVRDEASIKALLPAYWEGKDAMQPGAFLTHGRDRTYVAVRADVETGRGEIGINPYRLAYWSYLLLVLEHNFEQPLPLWFARGLTDLFSNTVVRDEDVEIGRVIPWYVERLRRGEKLPFRQLLAVDRSSPYSREGDKVPIFDANAWALLHFLMFGENGTLAPKLNRFASLLQGGTKPEVALAEAFGDLDALEKRADPYVHNLVFRFGRMPIDLDVKQDGFTTGPASAAESAGLRAAFHVAMKRPAEARALVAEGKAADPASPVALEAEGLLAELEDRDADAQVAYAKAAEQPAAGYYPLYRSAQFLFQPKADRDTLTRQESLLRRALESNDRFADGYSMLAEVLTSLERAAEAEAPARRAVALEPTRSYHHMALARVLSWLSRAEEAQKEARSGLALARTPVEESNARRFLDQLQQAEQATAQRAAAEAESIKASTLGEACRNGDTTACGQLVPSYEKQCAEGKAAFCATLGYFHETGRGVPADAGRAVAFYQMACDAAEKRACLSLAVMRAEGRGLPKDAAAAQRVMDELCGAGLAEACTQRAVLYMKSGTPRDIAQARLLLKTACDAGDKAGCSMLGSLPR